ncbi:hypothetical protein CVIRNUC_010207 [Coccomyxa viridis]|uniref:RING-type domain-containing protein n=1 Tax=Coccomyxa viridis TaxID=1274662 RepID=A0AAV1II35_9CHLO|nr:hypothetical protein CVIRNUC_010207 [Coccomyxa viridis]
MSVQDPQHMSSAVIIIDDEDEAGPSTRSSSGPVRAPRKRQRSSAGTPSSRRRASSIRAVQHVSSPRQASQQHTEAVIDLTSHSPEDALEEVLQPQKQKQKGSLPALVQQGVPLQPTGGAPEPQCPICLDPMKAMACGPCGHVFCDPCIRAAVKTQKKCPTCRKNMALKSIHRVYLDRR